MRLISVYDHPQAVEILYRLLEERTPEQSISHKSMPTMEQHRKFVESRPYEAWYLVEAVLDVVDCVALITEIVGAVYLTKDREIGIGILNQYKRMGYGAHAVCAIMDRHPGRFLWNVNPANTASVALCRKLGFGPEPIQHTYAKELIC